MCTIGIGEVVAVTIKDKGVASLTGNLCHSGQQLAFSWSIGSQGLTCQQSLAFGLEGNILAHQLLKFGLALAADRGG